MQWRSVVVFRFASLAAMAAGCGGGTSQPQWNPPFSGRRAFVVSSQVVTDVTSGGQGFTLVVDTDRRVAVLGGYRSGASTPLEAGPNGAFRFASPVSLSSALNACPGDSVRYDELEFKIDATGNVTGSGRGALNTVNGDVVSTSTGTISLTGVPDTQAPTVGLYTDGSMLSDPFIPFTFSSSEPLPPDARPVFRSATGDVVTPTCSPGGDFYVDCSPVLLPFDQAYTVDIANVTDFAGNRAMPPGDHLLIFGTGSAPLLVAADGFESQTDMTLYGIASFVSAPNYPVISGTRSLYVPPEGASPDFAGTTFALRLPIAPGSTVLRFAYRTLWYAATPGSDPTYLVGSVGSPLVTLALPPTNGTTTPVTIGGASFTLGPLTTATIDLPDPAASEVMLAGTVHPPTCGRPLPPPGGIIIDDLRTE